MILHAIHLKTGGFSADRNPILRIELARALPVGDDSQWLDLQVPEGKTVDPVAGQMVGFTDPLTWNAEARPDLEAAFELEDWLQYSRVQLEDPRAVFCCFGLPMIRRFLAACPAYRAEIAGEGWLEGCHDLGAVAQTLKGQKVIPDAKLQTLLAHLGVPPDPKASTALQVLRAGKILGVGA